MFETLETEEVERRSGLYEVLDGRLRNEGHYLDQERRREIPLRVEKAFRIPELNGGEATYLEIARDYGHTATATLNCPGSSHLRIWVLESQDLDLLVLDRDFNLSDCDGKGAVYDTPLVYWRYATGADLLIRRTGWESENYLVLTMEGNAVSVRTNTAYRR